MAYASQLLNNVKKNYTTTKQEALVMVYALHKFHHYLLGNKFIFYVNHMALLYLIKKPQLFCHIMRWLLVFFGVWLFNCVQTWEITLGSWCIVTITKSSGANWNSRLDDWCFFFFFGTDLVVRHSLLPINWIHFSSKLYTLEMEINNPLFALYNV